MKSLKRLIPIIFLSLLTACGTTMFVDREPEPESFADIQDLYDSIYTEMSYTPDQKKLIEFGRSLLGNPYTFGSSDPDNGFDCSGFTKYVYSKALNIKLPRTAKEMASTGETVSNTEDLQAGDLVFFNLLGYKYSHVGIYVGNGRFFHASTNKRKIVIGNMKNEYFAKRYNGARRILS